MPAAPMSCMPTTESVFASSNVASSNNFSWKGSPTCTDGKSLAESSVISLDAKAAPAIPSFPVAEPTIYTGLPGPLALAEIIVPASKIPAEKAFTNGFWLYDLSKNTSPPIIGIPKAFP